MKALDSDYQNELKIYIFMVLASKRENASLDGKQSPSPTYV